MYIFYDRVGAIVACFYCVGKASDVSTLVEDISKLIVSVVYNWHGAGGGFHCACLS